MENVIMMVNNAGDEH